MVGIKELGLREVVCCLDNRQTVGRGKRGRNVSGVLRAVVKNRELNSSKLGGWTNSILGEGEQRFGDKSTTV